MTQLIIFAILLQVPSVFGLALMFRTVDRARIRSLERRNEALRVLNRTLISRDVELRNLGAAET